MRLPVEPGHPQSLEKTGLNSVINDEIPLPLSKVVAAIRFDIVALKVCQRCLETWHT